MKTYPVGLAVTVSIPLEDMNGDPVVPTGLSYLVEDENTTEIVPLTTIDDITDPIEITIPGSKNLLATGIVTGARTVHLFMETDAGEIPVEVSYLIRGSNRLRLLVNSFQTYEQALIEATYMTRLDAWAAKGDDDRKTAMIEAFHRLTRLGYRIKWPRDDASWQQYLHLQNVERIAPENWPEITTDYWSTGFPETFKTAMRRAQIAEANQLLNVSTPEEKRRAGLLSESIGESSQMFRSGRPLDMGVSREALSYLTGFVDMRFTIARV